MTTDEAFSLIEGALKKALNKEAKINPQTDLVRDGVIDSLDGSCVYHGAYEHVREDGFRRAASAA